MRRSEEEGGRVSRGEGSPPLRTTTTGEATAGKSGSDEKQCGSQWAGRRKRRHSLQAIASLQGEGREEAQRRQRPQSRQPLKQTPSQRTGGRSESRRRG